MKEVVVISGKGGTGKTTLTASMAALWKDKVIADCDVDAADLHLLLQPEIKIHTPFYSGIRATIDSERCIRCGKCREVCVYGAITPDYKIDEIACEGCGVCYHFCPQEAISLDECLAGEWFISQTRFGPMAHAKLGIAQENSGKLVSLIRSQAKKQAEGMGLDLILSDGSPGIGCPVISSLTGTSLAVIVTEPTVSGVHDMDRILGLTAHFQIPSVVVINKCDLNTSMREAVEATAAETDVPVAGAIPYDPIITKAMVQGKTVVEFNGGAARKAIERISSAVLEKVK